MKNLKRYLLPYSGNGTSDLSREAQTLRSIRDSFNRLGLIGAAVSNVLVAFQPRQHMMLVPVRVACPQQPHHRFGVQRRGCQQ